MASLNEIAYNIHNLMRGGRSTNNEFYTLEEIKFAVKYYRALLIRRDLERNPVRTTPFEQDIGVLDLEKIDENDTYSDTPQYILRTTVDIPAPLRLKGREGITFVGSPSALDNYPSINKNRRRLVRHSRVTNTTPRSFYDNKRIYIVGDPNLERVNRYIRQEDETLDVNVEHIEKIRVRGVFVDPEEVIEFVNGSYDHNDEFPLPEDMIQRITQSIINGEMNAMTETLQLSDLASN